MYYDFQRDFSDSDGVLWALSIAWPGRRIRNLQFSAKLGSGGDTSLAIFTPNKAQHRERSGSLANAVRRFSAAFSEGGA